MKQLSRREFLLLLGTGAGGVAVTCTCATATGLLLIDRRPDDLPRPVVTLDTGVARPLIVSRAEWNALPPNHSASQEYGMHNDDNPEGWYVYDDALTTVYKTLVIHHSVIYEDNDIDTVREIQRTHRRNRGWADVGYHFLIGKNGTIFEGRELDVRGTHVGGHNTGSVGVCLLGNFMEETPTDPQIRATYQMVVWLTDHLALTHLAGHHHFNADTVCPGDNLRPYLHDFALRARLSIGTAGYEAP